MYAPALTIFGGLSAVMFFNGNHGSGAVVGLLTALVVARLAREIRVVELGPRGVTLRYVLGEREIAWADIVRIELVDTESRGRWSLFTRGSVVTKVVITRRRGKVRLDDFQPGMLALYDALRAGWETATPQRPA